jgi:hypothetical protein
VNANRRLDAAMPSSAAALANPRHSQRAPIRGSVGGREPGTHTEDGRAPHRQPHPAWREVNRMRRPSLEELQRQLEEDGGCEATDGCWVEPDGSCDHGQPSWLLALGLI